MLKDTFKYRGKTYKLGRPDPLTYASMLTESGSVILGRVCDDGWIREYKTERVIVSIRGWRKIPLCWCGRPRDGTRTGTACCSECRKTEKGIEQRRFAKHQLKNQYTSFDEFRVYQPLPA